MIVVKSIAWTAAAALLLTSLAGQQPPGQPPPATGSSTVPAGRGGGRGPSAAATFNEVCAACHGSSAVKGPTAPSVFDDEWRHGSDDEAIVKSIRDGFPEQGMPPFKDRLTEQETWQMVAYIRTTAANLKEKPVYVPDPDGQLVTSQKQTFRMEVVARNLETPWGIAFLPDGRMLITERPGRLRIVEQGKLLAAPVTGTPTVGEKQDGGLLDVEVHPEYARNGNGWIYISYSETLANPAGAGPGCPGRGGAPADPPSMTIVARGRINQRNEWVDQQILYRAPDHVYNSCNAHYGSRFIFDRQRHLFFSLGDKQQMLDAQELTRPTGKIHRINDDGTVPADNPFVGHATAAGDAVGSIWSIGHRNPQGLAWDPVTGELWASEHGPTGGDELNVVEPKKNYGWGVITMGVQNGITRRSAPGMEQPVRYWTPSVAPSGIAFYTGTRYPGWKNNLFVSCLVGQQLKRLEIVNGKVTHEEQVFNQFGRVHDVVQGPDGLLYVTLQLPGQVVSQSTAGMIARLVPVGR